MSDKQQPMSIEEQHAIVQEYVRALDKLSGALANEEMWAQIATGSLDEETVSIMRHNLDQVRHLTMASASLAERYEALNNKSQQGG